MTSLQPADNFSHTCISCSLLLLVLVLVIKNSGPEEFIKFPEKPEFQHYTTSKNNKRKVSRSVYVCLIMITKECSLACSGEKLVPRFCCILFLRTKTVLKSCLKISNKLVWRRCRGDMQLNTLWRMRRGSGNSCCVFTL